MAASSTLSQLPKHTREAVRFYWETRSKQSQRQQEAGGYSRDSRSDCQQVCIGLGASSEGLPLAYEVFAGNRRGVTTVRSGARSIKACKTNPVSPAMIERRIVRWLGRYPAADTLFQVDVLFNEAGQARGLSVACWVDRQHRAAQAQGADLLRTNCREQDPAKVWEWYLQLQQAEAAFRCTRSDLGLRPIFHHKTERVEARILVCFLALARWRVLEQWMKAQALGTCARQLLREVATVKSLNIMLPVRTQEGVTDLRLRTVARPEKLVAELLHRLGLHLPQQSRIIEKAIGNVVQKTTR